MDDPRGGSSMNQKIKDLCDFVENRLMDGWPFTLVLCLMWMVVGWSLHLMTIILDVWEDP